MKKVCVSTVVLLFVIGFAATILVAPQKDVQREVPLAMRALKCTTMLVGKNATANGEVLLAHNEDLEDNAAQHLVVVPRVYHGSGATYAGPGRDPGTGNCGTWCPGPIYSHSSRQLLWIATGSPCKAAQSSRQPANCMRSEPAPAAAPSWGNTTITATFGGAATRSSSRTTSPS